MGQVGGGEEGGEEERGVLQELERQARAPVGFVASSSGPVGGNAGDGGKNAVNGRKVEVVNPDALEVDIDDDD